MILLTQRFVKYLDGLYEEGVITKQQYVEMTKTKIRFIKHIKEKND